MGLTLAQEPQEQKASRSFIARVAEILGIEQQKLSDAILQAHLQMIDEALKQGRITQEQADRMKQQIEGRYVMLRMIDEALEQGRITQEQAAWMKRQIMGFRMGWGPRGFHDRWNRDRRGDCR
jgi:hypothetical protein